MKVQLLLLNVLFVFFFNALLAESPSYIRTNDEVIVFTDWDVIPSKDSLTLKTKKPVAIVALKTGADASFNLYEDEGTNYNYAKGAFSIIPINYNEATKTVTIDDRKGSLHGMLQKRTFRINLITPNKPQGPDFDGGPGKEVRYDGNKLTIRM